MRILVTGGAGFIGSHLAERLSASGHIVHTIDRKPQVVGGHHFRADVRDPDFVNGFYPLLDRAARGKNYDFIYHLASTVGVKNVLADPKEAIENIIESTRAVLSLGVPGMYFSTSEVYGRNEEDLSEGSEIRLSSKVRWCYAGAKLVCEWLALEAGWKVVRPFNVIGPRQNSDYGAVVPNFVSRAIEGKPLRVYGDGAQVRTFIDVRDFVEIVDELREKDFDVLNVGGQHRLRVKDLAVQVNRTLDSNYGAEFVPYADVFPAGFEECPRRVPDLSKLESLIGQRKYRSLPETILSIKEDLCRNLQMTA